MTTARASLNPFEVSVGKPAASQRERGGPPQATIAANNRFLLYAKLLCESQSYGRQPQEGKLVQNLLSGGLYLVSVMFYVKLRRFRRVVVRTV